MALELSKTSQLYTVKYKGGDVREDGFGVFGEGGKLVGIITVSGRKTKTYTGIIIDSERGARSFSFRTRKEALAYITHGVVVEAAAPYIGSLEEELDNESFLDGGR